jgi:hypothetical protein
VVDSDRGSGSGREAVGGRRVRTDCDRIGISAAAEAVVAMSGVGRRRTGWQEVGGCTDGQTTAKPTAGTVVCTERLGSEAHHPATPSRVKCCAVTGHEHHDDRGGTSTA